MERIDDTSHDAYIGLGANLGDREVSIRRAIELLGADNRTRVVCVAPIIQTPAMAWPGVESGGAYLNSAVCVRTQRDVRSLLQLCLAIEQVLGRKRREGERWGPRTIDMDILLFDDMLIDEPDLRVPHPGLAERLFVLEPLAAIARGVVVPGLGRSVAALLDSARNASHVGAHGVPMVAPGSVGPSKQGRA